MVLTSLELVPQLLQTALQRDADTSAYPNFSGIKIRFQLRYLLRHERMTILSK